MNKQKFKHPEAYCYMEYTCEKCGKVEILWNSRDGVTPYCIMCTDCDGTMTHSHWERDERYIMDSLDHLNEGQRYFCDLTEMIYLKIINKNIEQYTKEVDNVKNQEELDRLKELSDYYKERIKLLKQGKFNELIGPGEPAIKIYHKKLPLVSARSITGINEVCKIFNLKKCVSLIYPYIKEDLEDLLDSDIEGEYKMYTLESDAPIVISDIDEWLVNTLEKMED